MYTKVFVILMILLCILGMLSGCILYFGLDPSYTPTTAIIMMGISFVLTCGSLLGLIFLIGKKIAARGLLYPIDAFRSFRHGILISLLLASGYIFFRYDILTPLTGLLLFVIVFLLEIILTKTEDS